MCHPARLGASHHSRDTHGMSKSTTHAGCVKAIPRVQGREKNKPRSGSFLQLDENSDYSRSLHHCDRIRLALGFLHRFSDSNSKLTVINDMQTEAKKLPSQCTEHASERVAGIQKFRSLKADHQTPSELCKKCLKGPTIKTIKIAPRCRGLFNSSSVQCACILRKVPVKL